MVKKYKHKNTGTIVQQIRKDGDYECISTSYNLPKWSIENSSDWQEVKEEYPKIISFRSKRSDENFVIFYRSTDQCFTALKASDVGSFTLEHMLTLTHFEIYQVAKDKDTIFTIGDKTSKGVISHFRISSTNIIQFGIENAIFYYNIDEVKSKQYLLTTEDGIKLYEGDICYYLQETNEENTIIVQNGIEYIREKFKYFSSLEKIIEYKKNLEKVKDPLFITEDGVEIYDKDQTVYLTNSLTYMSIKAYKWNKTRMIFSTQEKAREYVDLNKPIFSKQQILDAMENVYIQIVESHIYIDKKGFKEKLGI
jgi:hypothetical protein